jgi:hypothetical protein
MTATKAARLRSTDAGRPPAVVEPAGAGQVVATGPDVAVHSAPSQ